MKKFMEKGKALVSFVTIFAVVITSLFTGTMVTAMAEQAVALGTDAVIEKWDKVSDGVTGDWYDGTFETGDGTQNNPYIISSAEELAWVCKNTTVENSKGVYYKVDPTIDAFDMNTVSGVDLTVDGLSAQQVKDMVAGKILGKVWHPGYAGCFAGSFDGSGVTIYGLYAGPAYYNQNSYDNNQPYGCNYAALFSKIDATTASFKNFCIKNSYFTGDVSAAVYAESIVNNGSATIENVMVSNCYIESKSGSNDGGALVGFCRYETATSTASKVKINNCLVYDNIIDSKKSSAVRLIGTMEAYCANASGSKVRDYENFSITNTVAIGCDIENSGSYWQKDSKMYSNCYTTGNPATENTTITKLANAEAAKGDAALENMTGLDKTVWFFNTTSYPTLRMFHDTTMVDNGDGTHAEVCECGLEGFSEVHNLIGGVCFDCDYVDPCTKGHDLSSVAGKPATKTENGLKAHDVCKVCEKTFINGELVFANDLIIPMLVTTSTFTGNYDTDLAGSGTKKDPYIITSADELAAVALGKFSSTESTYFKVLESITAFYMNGGETVAAMTSAEAVKEYFTANPGINWKPSNTFTGQFDGSGATVYGLYSSGTGQYDYAGLFPKIEGHSGIKNIAVKNSYFVSFNKDGAIAALIGGTVWKGDSNVNTSAAIENVVIANNYIASTNSTTSYGASVLMGRFFEKHYASVNNCMMYDNLVENAYTGVDIRTGMISGYAGTGTNTSFNNIIAIGVTPWTVVEMADGTYAHSGWFMTNMEGQYRNIYTDQSAEKLQAYNPTKNSDSALKSYNINVLTKEQMMGAAAKTNITTLDEDVWFFNTTTYPQIRVFHDITAESVGVDGHENEQDVCCGLQLLGEGVIPHSYEGNSCSVCGYVFPCAGGHNFTEVPAKDASYEAAGNIAYKHCSQCDKKYPMDAAIDESVTSAYNDSDVIIPQMLPYDEWDGTLATYFWMNNEGDGSAGNPFIIHSAEQLAAVVTANLKYDTSKPTSANFDISKYVLNGNLLDTTGLSFKIRDGLNYIYLNGGEALAALTTAEEVKAYFDANGGKNWVTGSPFNGTFNGNGAEIYGLYCVGNSTNGLFPNVDSSVSLKNIVLKNSYIVTSEGSVNSIAAGGLIGLAKWHTDSTKFGTVNVRSCVVANNYICSLSTDPQYGRVGAIAGNLFSNSIAIKDTLVYGNLLVNGPNVPAEYESGLVAYASGGNTTFKNIVTIGTVPYTEKANWHLYDNSKFVNVYTDTGITVADGAPYDYKSITKLTKEQMTGADAKANITTFNWETLWQVNDGGYPTPRVVNIKEYSSGTAWSGEIAKEFPSGDGSKSTPYTIPAAEYLALMLNSDNEGLYYKLTADIIINDTTAENWKETAKQWYTSNDVEAFAGYLDGNGFTVSGLYYDDLDAGDSAGLIPVKSSGDVTNITIADSYFSCYEDATIGAVVGSVVDGAAKPIILQGINVEESVVIEGSAIAGGIVGAAGISVIRISNCISKASIAENVRAGGIVASGSEGTSIKNTISVGTAPIAQTNGTSLKNVYTNVQITMTGVTVLGDDEMIGNAAESNMTGLDFTTIWTTVANDYPTLAGVIDASNGVIGEVWSGSIATAYAGGDGSKENPYLIATPEQLARCVKNHGYGKHYKLVADIYLNDVNSSYWEQKIGCNEWYTSKNSNWALFKNPNKYDNGNGVGGGGSFDGDGYIVFGLYYDRADFTEINQGAYFGLFPTVGQEAVIKNVAISHAYIAGSTYYYSNSATNEWFSDSAGALVGMIATWDTSFKSELSGSDDNCRRLTKEARFWDQMAIIENCLVDHTCYISGTYAGGLIGYANEPFRAYDCIFTGSLNGLYTEHTGGISGQDTANGAYYYRCVSMPQTCDRAIGGWANANWRGGGRFPTTTVDTYYFSKYTVSNQGTKLLMPSDRVGEGAKAAMPALDWENNWMVIEDGTPIQQIFAKHHTEEEYTQLSDKAFLAPYVTVSFVTGTNEFSIDEMVGRMYAPIELPELSREGYIFTGWYVFDDLSMKYPLDYFAPRDIQLYAGWEVKGFRQNFENYTNTIYDYNSNEWRLNTPGAKGGYKNQYARNGAKSLRLLDTNETPVTALLNYEDMLNIGQTYIIRFWVATDKEDNPDTVLSLVHCAYPEYNKQNKGVEEMLTVSNLTVGEWKQYTYTFTATTPWIALRAGANSSLYFDDIVVSMEGEDVGNSKLAEYLNTLNPDEGEVAAAVATASMVDASAPATGDDLSVVALVSVIIAGAVMIIISKKYPFEIIEQ